MKLKLLLLISLLAFIGNISAQETCNGTIQILEIQPSPVLAGEIAMIVIPLENITADNMRNLNVNIYDPLGNSISSEQFRVGNTTNTISRRLSITREFLSGNYSISTRLKILNSTDINQEICTLSANRNFSVETERKSYSDVSIEIEVLNATQIWDSNTSRNITINGVVLPINFVMRNLPVSANVLISDISISNEAPEITISPDVPYYPLDFVQKLQDRCVFSQDFLDGWEDDMGLLYKRCGDTVDYLRNESETWRTEREKVVYDYEILQNSSALLEQYTLNLTIQLEDSKRINILGANFLTGFLVGLIAILILLWRVGQKVHEKK